MIFVYIEYLLLNMRIIDGTWLAAYVNACTPRSYVSNRFTFPLPTSTLKLLLIFPPADLFAKSGYLHS